MRDDGPRFGYTCINRIHENGAQLVRRFISPFTDTSVQLSIASGSLMISVLTMHEALQHREAANRRKVRL